MVWAVTPELKAADAQSHPATKESPPLNQQCSEASVQPVNAAQQHNNPNKHPKGLKKGSGGGSGGMGSIIITRSADEQI